MDEIISKSYRCRKLIIIFWLSALQVSWRNALMKFKCRYKFLIPPKCRVSTILHPQRRKIYSECAERSSTAKKQKLVLRMISGDLASSTSAGNMLSMYRCEAIIGLKSWCDIPKKVSYFQMRSLKNCFFIHVKNQIYLQQSTKENSIVHIDTAKCMYMYYLSNKLFLDVPSPQLQQKLRLWIYCVQPPPLLLLPPP